MLGAGCGLRCPGPAAGRERAVRTAVLKFGGTSVATRAGRERAARHVLAAVAEGRRAVAVVSAMGRAGDPYATDTLLELVRAEDPGVPARELDLAACCGEILAAVLLAGTLRRLGQPAVALTGFQAGIVTDDRFGDARIVRVDPERLLRHLERGEVAVVAGFQGATAGGEITTLGRGGSDTTAAALGVALRAEYVDIFTDVDGVYTADPRVVPDARALTALSYEELAQMAELGARVVHPRAVDLAMRGDVPLRIRNTFGDGPGTLITHAWRLQGTWQEAREAGLVAAVVHLPGMTLVRVRPGGAGDRAMFRALADRGISLDMINVAPDRKAFIVREDRGAEALATLRGLGLQAEARPGCAKVTVVGPFRGVPGVMAAIVEALEAAGVEILLSVDSHMTISCLVPGEQAEAAVRALHGRFGLGGAAEPIGWAAGGDAPAAGRPAAAPGNREAG